jgi:dethiobiotin synthetase
MRRIVILGTGTGVGKTFFTASLARALTAASPGLRLAAVKPIETGVARSRSKTEGPAPGTDAASLEEVSTAPPYRPHPACAFADGVSAHLAARRAGRRVSPSAILGWLESNASHDTTLPVTHELIETAGGAFSPIGPRETNLDLAVALGPAVWILVAPDALGVLHDIRATLLAMTAVARAPDYLVLSAARAPDASSGTNAAELRRVGLPAPAVVLPRNGATTRAFAPLVRALLRA